MKARYSCQQQGRAQHAMQLKIELLEGQPEASAASARRQMEEQLEAFRGDATLARYCWMLPCLLSGPAVF